MIRPVDSRVSDVNAAALGVRTVDLMGKAGAAVAALLEERFPGRRVLFVCGSGNNGGDGFAAAMRMDPASTMVALLCDRSRIRSEESRYYFSLLECDIVPYDGSLIGSCDVVVDCALGTGTSGNVRGAYATFIDDVSGCGKAVVSVDVPSGLYADRSVRPDITVTFMDSKTGMDEANSGDIVIADIGIPPEALGETGPGDMLRYPVPDGDSHKGMNGRLMVIAGGPYYGAPAMCSYSAMRVGTDMVRLYAPSSIHDDVVATTPVLMVTDLPGDHLGMGSVDLLLRESGSYDAVLIGPGLGDHPETVDAVRAFAEGCDRPIVVDADAIGAVAGMRFEVDAVLTPHRGELARLGEDPAEVASRMGATVLLKGRTDTITDGTVTRLNRTGSPGMTSAGTGDVLAGCVAGLMSKGLGGFDAACLGAYICGRAGEMAFSERSYGLIATDVAEHIPDVLREGLR